MIAEPGRDEFLSANYNTNLRWLPEGGRYIERQLAAESLAEFAHVEHIGCGGGFEVPKDAGHCVVSEAGPVSGIGAIHGGRDAWREHFGGVPETRRHIQDFAGPQSRAGLRGFGEEGNSSKSGCSTSVMVETL